MSNTNSACSFSALATIEELLKITGKCTNTNQFDTQFGEYSGS